MVVSAHSQRPLTDPYIPRYQPRVVEPDTSPVVRAARRIGALDIVLGILFGIALFMIALALLPSPASGAETRAPRPPAAHAAPGVADRSTGPA